MKKTIICVSLFFALILALPMGGLAVEKQANLHLMGLFCPNCSAQIEDGLEALQGVISVSVDFETNKAFIRFDDQKTDAEQLADIVTDYGFEATVIR